MPQIYIETDANDADYVGNLEKISNKDLNKIRPLIEAIKKFTKENPYKHNYYSLHDDRGEKLPEELYPEFLDEIEILSDCCRGGEYGYHSIKNIIVYPDSVGEVLL